MKRGDELRNLVFERTGIEGQMLHCPREKFFMTPCVARDGDLAVTEDNKCVGCGTSIEELIAVELEKKTEKEGGYARSSELG